MSKFCKGFTASTAVLKPLLIFITTAIVIFTCGRLALLWHIADHLTSQQMLMTILCSGLRIDLATIGWISSALLVLSLICSLHRFLWRPFRYLYALLLAVMLTVMIMAEFSTIPFVTEYGVRPNRFVIEYSVYPQELFSMLWKSHRFFLLISLALWFSLPVLIYRFSLRLIKRSYPTCWCGAILLILLLLPCTIMMARSSFGHRPINPAMVAFSTDKTVNESILNSSYSLMYAISKMQHKQSAINFYGIINSPDLIQSLRENSHRAPQQYRQATAKLPTLSFTPAQKVRTKPLNIVIILMESFGAQFIKELGKYDLAPNFSALSQEGWFFTRAYATGTRSIRGIEAVISGFPPTPVEAVVKQDKAQSNFFTLPALLTKHGYQTSFIYGGESHFDNMKNFFLSNGISQVIEQKDYSNPSFVSSWGVSDEDLFAKAHATFLQQHASGKPFFSLVFTSSNHDPFEIPDGKITLYEDKPHSRLNAVKYADYALGEFFKQAKASPYYQDTLFLLIADHDARVKGRNLVAINHFHIPALLLGADITPRKDQRIVSQIDMAPTLLSYAGIDALSPMLGQDLNIATNGGRALMQYEDNFAYLTEQKIIFFQPHKKPLTYMAHQETTGKLLPNVPQFTRMAHAMAIAGDYLYSNEFYSSKYLNAQ